MIQSHDEVNNQEEKSLLTCSSNCGDVEAGFQGCPKALTLSVVWDRE